MTLTAYDELDAHISASTDKDELIKLHGDVVLEIRKTMERIREEEDKTTRQQLVREHYDLMQLKNVIQDKTEDIVRRKMRAEGRKASRR